MESKNIIDRITGDKKPVTTLYFASMTTYALQRINETVGDRLYEEIYSGKDCFMLISPAFRKKN